MGVKGLFKLLSEKAPSSIKEKTLPEYFGLKIAVDTSMHIYQFLVCCILARLLAQTHFRFQIGVRTGPEGQSLTNAAGEVTSHLQGLWNRTARMLEAGIKPIFVFDGKPPQLKKNQLDKRFSRRADAAEDLQAAQDEENVEEVQRQQKRLVKVTKEHNEECKKLLRLMGVPVIDAPGEAEAQCCEFVRAGKAYAVATEDMDALTFGAPKVARHFFSSGSAARGGDDDKKANAMKKHNIIEIDLASALDELAMNREEFIDLCILLGCDYADSIKGVGPAKAFQLITQHRSIASALPTLDSEKHPLPGDFLYAEAAQLFLHPDVQKVDDMQV